MKRILVPLLTCEDAETLVPLVGALAKGEGATVRCVHVRPIPGPREGRWGRIVATPDQEMERLAAKAQTDLKIAEARLQGVSAESVVRFGTAAREILIEAEAWDADLIALMGARGTWIRRLGVRGVARAVLRRASIPVVFYRPSSPSLAARVGRRLQSLFPEGLPASEVIGMEGRW